MKHINQNNVAIMISLDKHERRGNTEHLTKFNVLKGVDFNVGDIVGNWLVKDIINSRQSTMKACNYIECMCAYIN